MYANSLKMNKDEIQQLCLSKIDTNKRCGVVMSMGTGKTRVGLLVCEKLLNKNPSERILVVYPKTSIKESWLKEMDLINFKYKHKIDFSTYLSVYKIDLSVYTYLICDESHSITPNSFSYLNSFKRVLGLTGTPITNIYSEKYSLFNTLFPTVFKYSINQAIDNNILNEYNVHIHYIPLSLEKNILTGNKSNQFYTSESSLYSYYDRLVRESFGSTKRFNIIKRLTAIKKFESKILFIKKNILPLITKKTLIFCTTQDHADSLCHSYHSKNPDSKKNLELFKTGKIKVLSCVEQLSEGINIPNLETAIIEHAYASEVKLPQKLGRILRLATNKTATLHILVYKNTIDEEWVNSSLKGLNTKLFKHYYNYDFKKIKNN